MAKRKAGAQKPRPIDGLNRVVLPKEVRDALDASAGDYVLFEVDGNAVRLRKVEWVAR